MYQSQSDVIDLTANQNIVDKSNLYSLEKSLMCICGIDLVFNIINGIIMINIYFLVLNFVAGLIIMTGFFGIKNYNNSLTSFYG